MPSHRTSPPGALLVRLLVASVLLGVAGCVPEAGEPLSWAEATGATGVAGQPATATATVALAEFEGYADPATGAFSVQVVRSFDPYTQLQAIYEGNGMRTVGQALPRSTPAPWCTGIVVNDGALGTNPPNTFELWTDPASIASALPGAPTVPAACNVGDTSLYSIDGVFCATVRAMNFHGVPWSDVATQIHLFGGDAATQGGYAYPYGTGLQTVDGTTGDPLPSYTNLPDPGDELGIWGYGTLGASGGQATRTWTFRNGSAGSFRFRGRVLGRVAEDCATADVNEDCDPAGRGDNACRLYTEGEACDDDLDCVSYLCTAGACAADCAAGLWGAACQECPGGWSSPCSDQGVCDDGVSGDGSCTCDTDYYSADCSVQCAPDETWTQATGCVPRECPAGLHDYFGDGLTCIDAQLASSGKNHTCAIKQDHSLWCWGRNDSGQLGIGSAVSRVNPTQVGIGTDWVWVSTGAFHTCGLRYNGDMYCWGSPSSGKLGDGQTTTARTSPIQVGAGVQWRAVTTGEAHTCAIDADEGLWCGERHRTAGLAMVRPRRTAARRFASAPTRAGAR